jgi:hypothetical protein
MGGLMRTVQVVERGEWTEVDGQGVGERVGALGAEGLSASPSLLEGEGQQQQLCLR